MVYAIERNGRFTGYYRDRAGNKKSAGTFDSKSEALRRAENAESQGELGEYRLSMTLSEYVRCWLRNAELLPMTKKNYESILETHVLPHLGTKKIGEITRAHVRAMMQRLSNNGVSGSVRMHAKAALGSAFKELLENELIDVNPTHKITIKMVRKEASMNVLTPKEFQSIVANLEARPVAQLFAKLLVTSGCRFGEATELRAKDVDIVTGEVYVERRVSELGARVNNGERFKVIAGTKSGRTRVVTVSKALVEEVHNHILQERLQPDDLLFPKSLVTRKVHQERVGQSLTIMVKRSISCGTRASYTHGCRCDACREANRQYHAQRRAMYVEPRTLFVLNTTDHLPRDTWRDIWQEAVKATGMKWMPRTHDLRHTNATQLLKSGVDLHEVKERLGHQSISTTEGYLHRVRHLESKASEATDIFLEEE